MMPPLCLRRRWRYAAYAIIAAFRSAMIRHYAHVAASACHAAFRHAVRAAIFHATLLSRCSVR